MPKKTEAELLQEADRQAEDALARMEQPAETYLAGNLEFEEEQREGEAKSVLQAEDQRSAASDRARIVRLEELVEKNSRLVQALLEGFKSGSASALILPATPDDLPRPHKQWTEAELQELVSITIFPETDPNQNRPVSVAPNGVSYSIPRGVPTRVPRCVALILEQAVIESWEHPIEGGQYVAQKTDLTPLTTTLPVLRRLPRFNFAYN